MAYSDYGAFTYCNGKRRPDKEDVGVFDTDEAGLPSGVRIFANLIKNRERGTEAWWQHSHHGVLGDGPVRVGCYKQGLGSSRIYFWPDGAAAPQEYAPRELTGAPPELEFEYDHFEVRHDFGSGEYLFTFTDDAHSASGHYEATMTEPDGTHWACTYDYGYGAGLNDIATGLGEPGSGKRATLLAIAERIFRPTR